MLSFRVGFPPSISNADANTIRAGLRQFTDKIASVPGVNAVSLTTGAKPLDRESGLIFWRQGQPKPPKHLSTAAKRWWSEVQTDFAIEDRAGLLILTAAAEAFDRTREAEALLKIDGLTSVDRFGQRKPHPAVVIARDSRAQMLAALKQLNLDLEPVRDSRGRPPGL